MRDIIWTIIIVWLVYKVVEILKGSSGKKQAYSEKQHQTAYTSTPRKDVKEAVRKSASKEGEYVDFEEIK